MADGLKHKAKNPLGQKAGSFKYSLCHRFALTKMVLVGLNLNTRNMPRNLGDVPNLTNRFGLGRTSTQKVSASRVSSLSRSSCASS